MKISLGWIKEFVDLDGISTNEIVSKLTMSGLEVEDVVEEAKQVITEAKKKVNEKPKAKASKKIEELENRL